MSQKHPCQLKKRPAQANPRRFSNSRQHFSKWEFPSQTSRAAPLDTEKHQHQAYRISPNDQQRNPRPAHFTHHEYSRTPGEKNLLKHIKSSTCGTDLTSCGVCNATPGKILAWYVLNTEHHLPSKDCATITDHLSRRWLIIATATTSARSVPIDFARKG